MLVSRNDFPTFSEYFRSRNRTYVNLTVWFRSLFHICGYAFSKGNGRKVNFYSGSRYNLIVSEEFSGLLSLTTFENSFPLDLESAIVYTNFLDIRLEFEFYLRPFGNFGLGSMDDDK